MWSLDTTLKAVVFYYLGVLGKGERVPENTLNQDGELGEDVRIQENDKFILGYVLSYYGVS